MRPRRASFDPECSCGEVDGGLPMLRLDRFSIADYLKHVRREASMSLGGPSVQPSVVFVCTVCGCLMEPDSMWLVDISADCICLPCASWFWYEYVPRNPSVVNPYE
jgi:hypothetical protein